MERSGERPAAPGKEQLLSQAQRGNHGNQPQCWPTLKNISAVWRLGQLHTHTHSLTQSHTHEHTLSHSHTHSLTVTHTLLHPHTRSLTHMD